MNPWSPAFIVRWQIFLTLITTKVKILVQFWPTKYQDRRKPVEVIMKKACYESPNKGRQILNYLSPEFKEICVTICFLFSFGFSISTECFRYILTETHGNFDYRRLSLSTCNREKWCDVIQLNCTCHSQPVSKWIRRRMVMLLASRTTRRFYTRYTGC